MLSLSDHYNPRTTQPSCIQHSPEVGGGLAKVEEVKVVKEVEKMGVVSNLYIESNNGLPKPHSIFLLALISSQYSKACVNTRI